jgi:NADH-quinone oxidoreductase subunit F
MWVYKILEPLLKQSCWFLGKNILGSGYDLELYVHLVLELTFVVKKLH